jgi:hypothetical protein
MAGFQFHLRSTKQRKVGWVGTTVVLFSVTNSLVKRMCETVRCRDATAGTFAPKARGEVFEHFQAVAVKRHSSMRTRRFALTKQVTCKQSP